ncbi:3868_t:CDS:2 [Racocetra fulgida]|uniref:3868_t:CDS:1 n=1 Tax=Racocetra fulgida TaxID=60492 RepID=A0A9N9F1N3_9GLOM|nr:3868_t:CDS:2 [Racocetra fulgida]
MKFGSQLRAALYDEWAEYYVDYDGLKKLLKRGINKEGGYTGKDETEFVEKLDKELEKVYSFQNSKYEDIKSKVQQCENSVNSISKDSSSNASERYIEIEQQINDITEELNELAKYNSSSLSNLPSVPASSAALPSRERFMRQSHKYWIHPDNVMEVKTTILRNLPVLIYKPGTDASVTSIYFDNEAFELYQDKVDRKPGDQLIRLRWFGNKESTNEIFVERKIREQGEEEIKDRFLIKEKYVDGFLKGTYSMDKTIKKMKENPGKTEDDVENFQALVKDIQDIIKEKNLQPVRISLDTEYYMIREDNFGAKRRQGDAWRRTDIDDADFGKLSQSECTKFPYAILEIKLNLDGEQEPNWVKELIKSGLVEEAPQFSKYVHGVATLFTSQAPSLPYWLPNIDKDILKPSARQSSEEYDEDYDEGTSSALYGINQERAKRSGKNIIDIDSRDRRDKGKAVEVYKDDDEDEQFDENQPLLGADEGLNIRDNRPIGGLDQIE